MQEILVKNIQDEIIEEIAELTKINGKAPCTLTIAEDIKTEIFQILNIGASSSQVFSEFRGLKVTIIPTNNLLSWILK